VPATRGAVREWLEQFAGGGAEFALEGRTGWRFVVEEIERAGHRAHLADPAETAGRRGRKRRAKTDNADCDLQLKLLLAGELPESWIPPAHILELRTRVRMRKVLIDQRTAWQQRLQAQLFHQGVAPGLKPRTPALVGRRSRRWSCPRPGVSWSRWRYGCWRRSTVSWPRSTGRCARSPAASAAAVP
jgi:transposase